MALFREAWQCLAEADAEACILADPGRAAADAHAGRPRAADLAGEWKVLDVTGVPVTETDPLSGACGGCCTELLWCGRRGAMGNGRWSDGHDTRSECVASQASKNQHESSASKMICPASDV